MISVFLTLMSNFFIKKHKNFDQLVAKIDSLNSELEQLDGQISMSQEQQSRIDYVNKELEKRTQELTQLQLKVRVITGIISFILNQATRAKYSGKVIMISPVKLVGPLKSIAQRGLKNADDYQIGLGLFSMLFNRGVRAMVNKLIAVRMPRGKNPISAAKKLLGMTGEEVSQTQKFSDFFSML